jgi:quinol monooxygenase YgiN
MVMTMLEAKVKRENWAVLEAKYREVVAKLDPRIARTYLIQSVADPTLWRMMGVWAGREAVEQMRASEVPPGILIFRAAGAEPVLALFDVVAEAAQS